MIPGALHTNIRGGTAFSVFRKKKNIRFRRPDAWVSERVKTSFCHEERDGRAEYRKRHVRVRSEQWPTPYVFCLFGRRTHTFMYTYTHIYIIHLHFKVYTRLHTYDYRLHNIICFTALCWYSGLPINSRYIPRFYIIGIFTADTLYILYTCPFLCTGPDTLTAHNT